MLSWTDFIAEALLFIGGAVFTLTVSIGALFIIFGTTQRNVSKGYELIKQSIVGLAVLASGTFLKYIVVGLVFQTPDTATACS